MSREQLGPDPYTDSLTGLANRAHFDSELDRAITTNSGNFGVLFIDLDGLKIANDTGGHEAGNKLLREVANKLTDHFRVNPDDPDSEPDCVARLGGDEFAVIVRDIQAPLFLHLIAARTQELIPNISVGAAIHQKDETSSRVLARADAAMYENKQARQLSNLTFKQLGAIAAAEEILAANDVNPRNFPSYLRALRGNK